MFPKSASLMGLALVMALAGCGRKAVQATGQPPAPADAASYVAPPGVSAVQVTAEGTRLLGHASPGAQVRLATPEGQATLAQADSAGRWSLTLPPASDPRIFGLSAASAGRRVQAQGYILVTPQGAAAQLRAGTGAIRLDDQALPAIGAVDFDKAGAAAVAGRAKPGELVTLALDGRQVGAARADTLGRYVVALGQPLAPGPHLFAIAAGGAEAQARVDLAPPEPLAAGPMRSQLTRDGLRVDWLTPGGGLQSTVLPD